MTVEGTLLAFRNDRQHNMRRMICIMLYGLHCCAHFVVVAEYVTSVGVAIESWEIRRGDFKSDTVPFAKDIARNSHFNFITVN